MKDLTDAVLLIVPDSPGALQVRTHDIGNPTYLGIFPELIDCALLFIAADKHGQTRKAQCSIGIIYK
ncbi:MAG: hypothetical protein MUF15_20630 [Acidobacteria bacterium]|nr:hypothetical protein [Acidobacteriota bacterium]